MRASRSQRIPGTDLSGALEETLGGRWTTAPVDRAAMAHNASHYLETPRAVATPESVEDVAALMRIATRAGTALTFRSGGTSLSGQASSGEILVDTRTHFRAVTVGDRGETVTSQPGATLRLVNGRLARHGRRLGPDPASEIACTIGGVVANNSSGMECGTAQNAYATLESAVLVLASGTIIDTSLPDAALAAAEPALHAGLAELRDRLRADAESVATVRRLFSMKNTMGYALNALLDFDEPMRILEHLAVGSEGTLCFVAEATFATVPAPRHATTALLVLPTLNAAASAVGALADAGAAAIELLDVASLRIAQRAGVAPAPLDTLDLTRQCALLVEAKAQTPQERDVAAARLDAAIASLPTEVVFRAHDEAQRSAAWALRKGLYTIVAGGRTPGTTALLEDVAVPREKLAQACEALEEAFARYGYEDAAVFGHAKDGNLHFLVSERFDEGHERYERFTEELVELILGLGGTLKAEHGTGRAMAPFVERQYGPRLTEIMWDIKRLLDPHGILNPGAVLTHDALAHTRHLKPAALVDPLVDSCVECGYCETVCPSANLTTTPRTRIALLRDVAAAHEAGDTSHARELEASLRYSVVDTCAADGMCQTACPVGIDTGVLVKGLRADAAGPVTRAGASVAARHWGAVTRTASMALTVASHVPAAVPRGLTRAARAVVGEDRVPQWSADLPQGGPARATPADERPDVLLFGSCMGTLFGATSAPDGILPAADAVVALARRAGLAVGHVPGVQGLCCGAPFASKGLVDAHAEMADRTVAALAEVADLGIPVVTDAASCAESLAAVAAGDPRTAGIEVLDATEWLARAVLPLLPPAAARWRRAAIHPTCASTRTGAASAVEALTAACATEVYVPDEWRCCGFAGDRGMLHPELTQSATAREAAQVLAAEADLHVSSNRACELALDRATGEDYVHVASALELATRPGR